MSILSRLLYTSLARHLSSLTKRSVTSLFIVASLTVLGISGCGQKGALYLADTSDADSSTQMVTAQTDAVLASGSQPQDTAFANLDDMNDDRARNLEQNQILPAVSDDPNNY